MKRKRWRKVSRRRSNFSNAPRSSGEVVIGRYIGNPILSGIGLMLFRCPAHDFHCGLRGFSKDAFLRMDMRTTGMKFASEMVIKATLMKMRIAEVPTRLDPDGRSRPPHWTAPRQSPGYSTAAHEGTRGLHCSLNAPSISDCASRCRLFAARWAAAFPRDSR
jgi:hypothetical protein